MDNKKIGLFIFRRDLRLFDNLALYDLSQIVDIIIPIFISFNKKQKFFFHIISFYCSIKYPAFFKASSCFIFPRNDPGNSA